MDAAIRTWCLSRPEPIAPADLQRVHRLTYSEACRALELLEAMRLLGSLEVGGRRVWSASFPPHDIRVAALRLYFGAEALADCHPLPAPVAGACPASRSRRSGACVKTAPKLSIDAPARR